MRRSTSIQEESPHLHHANIDVGPLVPVSTIVLLHLLQTCMLRQNVSAYAREAGLQQGVTSNIVLHHGMLRRRLRELLASIESRNAHEVGNAEATTAEV